MVYVCRALRTVGTVSYSRTIVHDEQPAGGAWQPVEVSSRLHAKVLESNTVRLIWLAM